MTVTLELDAAARARGRASAFVATGQTGIAIAGWGIAVDHVISDYIAGAAERLVPRAPSAATCCSSRARARSCTRPTRASRSGLLHGCRRTRSCSATGPGRRIDDYPEPPIPPLPELVALYEGAIGWVRPAPVVAIALNTRGLADEAARRDGRRGETGLPATTRCASAPSRLWRASCDRRSSPLDRAVRDIDSL